MGETIKSLMGSMRDSADEKDEKIVPEELEEEYLLWLEDNGQKDSDKTRKSWMQMRKALNAPAEEPTSAMGGMLSGGAR